MTETKCIENNRVIKDLESMNNMDENLLDEECTHEDFQGATLQIHNDTYYLNSRSPSPKAEASKTAANMQVAPSSVPLNGDENARDYFSFRSGLVESAIEECVKTVVFPEKDGEVIGCWLLTEISLWDAEKERLVILTTHTLITVKYDFIALRQLDHRAVPLRLIDTLVIGDLVYPSASLVPARNTRGVRALWNRGAPISFGRRWNPFNSDIPFVTYTFHPLYWARLKQKETQGNDSIVEEKTYDLDYFSEKLVLAVKKENDEILKLGYTPKFEDFKEAMNGKNDMMGSQDYSPTSLNVVPLKVEQCPIVLQSYVGLGSLIHNRNGLGFFKVRGKFSF